MDTITRAFLKAPRQEFLPETVKHQAAVDIPLPIGFGVTNSQPSTVRMMLRWLAVKPGDKVLDVGSGSGWTTALLSGLTGKKGEVYAVEVIPELVEFGRQNVKKLDIKNARFFEAGQLVGLPEYAPFERILVSAAAAEVPERLLSQLKPGGKMVIPVKDEILEISKQSASNFKIKLHYGFAFVPLISR